MTPLLRLTPLLLACCNLLAQEPAPLPHPAKTTATSPEAGSDAERKPNDLRITPNPALPNVLILGDSISIGYHKAVREMLKGKANVFRPVNAKNGTADNCSDTSKGVATLETWLAMEKKWDVIHFNWGLHDIKHVKPGTLEASADASHPRQRSHEEYRANLEAIVAKLKTTGARLVYCTTTPVAPGTSNPYRSNEDVEAYNAIAVKVMKEKGIPVNDLYAFAKERLDKIQLPKNVHFTDAGSKALAVPVAEAIGGLLPKKSP